MTIMNTNSNPVQISKRINVKILALAIAVFTAGIIAFVYSTILIGSILLISGVLLFAIKAKNEVYEPTGSIVYREICYFDKEALPKVESIVRSGFANGDVLPLLENGSGKMEIIKTADSGFIAVQMYKFIPYKFVEHGEQICYTGINAKKLIECIEHSPINKQ